MQQNSNDPKFKRFLTYLKRKTATKLNRFFFWLENLSDDTIANIWKGSALLVLIAILWGMMGPHGFWRNFLTAAYYIGWFCLTIIIATWVIEKFINMIIKIRRWAEINAEDEVQ